MAGWSRQQAVFSSLEGHLKTSFSGRGKAAFAKVAPAFHLHGKKTCKSPLHAGNAWIMFASSFGRGLL